MALLDSISAFYVSLPRTRADLADALEAPANWCQRQWLNISHVEDGSIYYKTYQIAVKVSLIALLIIPTIFANILGCVGKLIRPNLSPDSGNNTQLVVFQGDPRQALPNSRASSFFSDVSKFVSRATRYSFPTFNGETPPGLRKVRQRKNSPVLKEHRQKPMTRKRALDFLDMQEGLNGIDLHKAEKNRDIIIEDLERRKSSVSIFFAPNFDVMIKNVQDAYDFLSYA